MGQHVGVARSGEGRDVAVVLAEDDVAEGVAVVEVAPVVEPRRRVGDHHVALAPTDWYMEPMRVDSGSLSGAWIQLTVVSEGSSSSHRVLGGVLVTDLQAVGADGGRLQPDLAVAGVGAQEGEVDAAGVGRGRPLAHGLGPVLVVTQAEEATMVHEELRLGVQVDVGPVGHVQPEALEVEQQRQLVADEVGRPRAQVWG